MQIGARSLVVLDRSFAACVSRPPRIRRLHVQNMEQDWKRNILQDTASIREVASQARRVAVLGIKTEKQADQPAFYVAKYLRDAGLEVVPVPIYYPEVQQILDKPVYRTLKDVPPPLDIVNVFRRPVDISAHVEDILAARPQVVWLQSGIRHPESEEVFAKAGIKVVADRCLMVEHRASKL